MIRTTLTVLVSTVLVVANVIAGELPARAAAATAANADLGWGCQTAGIDPPPATARSGEICDGQSPDMTQCAYMTGRRLLQHVYLPQYQVEEQLWYTHACGGVAWTRIIWRGGNPGYRVDQVDTVRADVADSGDVGENDGSAWWSALIAAVPGDCISTSVWIADAANAAQLPVLKDCS